ncbi:hypothetical protein [Nocardia thraciensis]
MGFWSDLGDGALNFVAGGAVAGLTALIPGGKIVTTIGGGLIGAAVAGIRGGSWSEVGEAAAMGALAGFGGAGLARAVSSKLGDGARSALNARLKTAVGGDFNKRMGGLGGDDPGKMARMGRFLMSSTRSDAAGAGLGTMLVSSGINPTGGTTPIPASMPTRPAGQDGQKIPFDKEAAKQAGKENMSPTVGSYKDGYSQWPLETV